MKYWMVTVTLLPIYQLHLPYSELALSTLSSAQPVIHRLLLCLREQLSVSQRIHLQLVINK